MEIACFETRTRTYYHIRSGHIQRCFHELPYEEIFLMHENASYIHVHTGEADFNAVCMLH